MAIDSIMKGNPGLLSFFGDPPWAFVLIAGIPASGLVLAGWTHRALEAAEGRAIEIQIPPICEGCGYDLTHLPQDQLCPECGLAVDSSLEPLIRRPGSDWERRGSIGSLLRTVGELILSPRAFYGRLQLRTPVNGIGRFESLQLLAIGIGAAVWLLAVFLRLRGKDSHIPVQVFFFPFAFGLIIPFVGWGLHRLLTAVIVSHWVWQRALPNFAWARKVFCYESAFLWIFCLFNGIFFTTIFLGGLWLSGLTKEMLGQRPLYVFGIPPEPLTVLVGNFILCGLWVWRYYIALAAIRWSNF
ncbi:MAG TPA: hypothetical protein VJZ71_00670 [Phycisphaerae bacterium]|nr:hypothetical protein [Phycisphaerae bacterium]